MIPHESPTSATVPRTARASTSSSVSEVSSPGGGKRPWGGLKPSKNGRLEDGEGKVTAITIAEFEKQKKHLEGQLSDSRAKVARLSSGRPTSRFSQPYQGGGYGGGGGGGGGGDGGGGDRNNDQRPRRN